MFEQKADLLSKFVQKLADKPVTHLWHGYGTTLHIELGKFTSHQRRDGSYGAPMGEMGIMIEQDWRIEGRKSILCGSSSDERLLNRAFSLLRKQKITSISQHGKLAEIDVEFSNGIHCISFATLEGQPAWALFDRTSEQESTLIPHLGKVQLESIPSS